MVPENSRIRVKNIFLETFTESEVPERSPDSGIMSEKISQSTDDVLSPSTETQTVESSPSQTDKQTGK